MEPLSGCSKKVSQYKCNRCDKGFTTPGNLKRHILNIHLNDETRSLDRQVKVCRYCQKSYSRIDYLNQHIRSVHEKVVKYDCTHCGKIFTQKGSLTRHVNSVHMNVKEFHCKHCNYKAVSYNDLKKHAANSHFNRSRFECSLCGFSHWSASVVKVHASNFHSLNNKVNSRKCRYCGMTVNLSNESFTLHAAACKTMLGSVKHDTSKKKSKNSVSCDNNDVDFDLDVGEPAKALSVVDIPWYDLVNNDDEKGEGMGKNLPFPVHEIPTNDYDDNIEGIVSSVINDN